MQQRGFTPEVVNNIIKNGIASPNKIPGRTTHFDHNNNISVITETNTGKIITISYGNLG